jgi:hypothetical protein
MFIKKNRPYWNLRSYQLIREQAASKYLREVLPSEVSGFHILCPEVNISFLYGVTAVSRAVNGKKLFDLLYDASTQEYAISAALAALMALNMANINANKFSIFNRMYYPVRSIKTILYEICHSAILLPKQKRIFFSMLYNNQRRIIPGQKKSLVHGDLHAGNLIVDAQANTLALVDLELLHLGQASVNFSQLWISFYFADPKLGKEFYNRCAEIFQFLKNGSSDLLIRTEIALKCYSMAIEGPKVKNNDLEEKSVNLLRDILEYPSFSNFIHSITDKTT